MNGQTERDLWRCKLPEDELGSAKIQKFKVSEHASCMESIRGSWIPAGDYTRLRINGQLVMSDTPLEYREHGELFLMAGGDVLINGLGLGCAVSVLLGDKDVSSITVIEINKDVIDLVGPHFPDVEIIHADALTWNAPKGKRWETVWHDIWATKCLDNIEQMKTLHRRYGKRCDWQGSWSREYLEEERRQEKRDRERRRYYGLLY